MRNLLSRREGLLLLSLVVVLVAVSIWQHAHLQAIQLEQKKAHYAERVRTAQLILENEMLRAAYLTATNETTRQLAQDYLKRFPE